MLRHLMLSVSPKNNAISLAAIWLALLMTGVLIICSINFA
jgi:hypothetical protein